MIRPTILEDADQTGFETNALKETESVMVNSGRNLKNTPIGGPYKYKEVREKVKKLIDERVVKPFEEDEEAEKPAEEESAMVSAAEPVPVKADEGK